MPATAAADIVFRPPERPRQEARLRRRRIGYVFQDLNLLAGFTAIQDVTLPLDRTVILQGGQVIEKTQTSPPPTHYSPPERRDERGGARPPGWPAAPDGARRARSCVGYTRP